MQRAKKNYLIYAVMLLLFGALIYMAIEEGDRFSHHAVASSTVAEDTPFTMFCQFVTDNLHHPLSILLIQIIAVLLMVRLFGFLFKHIGQPGVIGEIVAGIVLGPSVLGYFFPDVFQALFPPESLTNLELLSQVGLVLFMFVIGMELDFSVLKNKINETLVISHAGILVPFFLGIVASYWIYEEYAAAQTAFLPFALFIGISMSITAFPVLARIIQERNMTKTSLGTLAIASAANDDVTAWCLLAVVIAIAKAGTFASALYAIGLTALYIIIMFMVVRPFLKKVGEVYANQEVINKTFVALILLILIISSTLTEIIGIHALFGAFMAGVVMPPSIGFRKVMMEKVEDIALVFFLPLFFAFTGLRTEIGLINSPALWGVCLLLITVAVAGKLGGCAVAARLVGESWKDSFTIGTLMNTRGLMELVALNIGYEMGVLPPSIFVILVIMALVTTFMTTPLLHLVERIFARREERLSAKLKLVFCFGRPESGRSLLSIFFLLFGKKMKAAQVVAVHFTVGTDLNPLNAEQYARDSFSLVDEKASELGLSVENRYRVTDKLVQDMIRLARKERPDMFLLGAGSKYRPDTAGSNGVLWLSLFRDKIDDVMEQVKCPVAVFVNRGYSGSSPVSFVLGGVIDAFLLTYLESMLEGGAQVHLFLFDTDDEAFRQSTDPILAKYSSQIRTQPFSGAANLTSAAKDGLLVMSHLSYTKLSEEEEVFRDLPSLLVIRRPKKG
ncbi:cation:proton antiporter [Bacteroides fragilis]|uniref:Sodium/hydrogen exchanger family protein n=1 Tax=Bacteroides fragilis str. 3783N1-6 TaxID=1339310 RepID=A0AB73AHJ4_BACFG|nr:cation:proton antiporter [Bacteroides fragilis]EXY50257.1 sodium/hydrogen exchanger family protein [Bacteroides fragilis str. 3783N2-1]EXY55030.1 sodium/hydrogen exchanger family protein [Bacteroides fragilis str. 3976T7]EXZ66977.1 sodium/hydrogen exchanger family protein [Bacteroides fragilis str. 3783N1-8]EYB08644.1 sodium/hydrogen exchanger family protein [Bacteroides fragilis str. 3783N1-6]